MDKLVDSLTLRIYGLLTITTSISLGEIYLIPNIFAPVQQGAVQNKFILILFSTYPTYYLDKIVTTFIYI